MTSQCSTITAYKKKMRLKIHKRVRFNVDPLLDRDFESPEHNFIDDKHVHDSEVLEEDPLDANKDFGEPSVLTEKEFWDYVHSHVWSGRLRVCEGNLLRTLIRVFDELVVNRKLGSAESTQYHDAIQLRGRNKNTLFVGKGKITNRFRRKKKKEVKTEDCSSSCNQTKSGAFKIVLTFYGGKPMGKRQKVAFDTRSNVDTSPRLTRLFPIIKGSRLTQRRRAIVNPEAERELIARALNAKSLDFFVTRTPSYFWDRCVQAANDFIVAKEQIIDSKDWKIRTNITISRKLESRFGVFKLTSSLPRFYENKTMIIR